MQETQTSYDEKEPNRKAFHRHLVSNTLKQKISAELSFRCCVIVPFHRLHQTPVYFSSSHVPIFRLSLTPLRFLSQRPLSREVCRSRNVCPPNRSGARRQIHKISRSAFSFCAPIVPSAHHCEKQDTAEQDTEICKDALLTPV